VIEYENVCSLSRRLENTDWGMGNGELEAVFCGRRVH